MVLCGMVYLHPKHPSFFTFLPSFLSLPPFLLLSPSLHCTALPSTLPFICKSPSSFFSCLIVERERQKNYIIPNVTFFFSHYFPLRTNTPSMSQKYELCDWLTTSILQPIDALGSHEHYKSQPIVVRLVGVCCNLSLAYKGYKKKYSILLSVTKVWRTRSYVCDRL